MATASIILWRVTYAKVFVQPTFRCSLLVVGAAWASRTLAQAVAKGNGSPGNPYHGTGYQTLGFVDDDPRKVGQEIEGLPVLGGRGDLLRLVRELHPCELVVAITDLGGVHPDLFRAILACCSELGVLVTTMPDLYERMTGRLPVAHVGRNLHAVLPLDRPALYRLYQGVRRLIEILIALLGCLLTLLVAPFLWLADRIASPGALFYTQQRVGQRGRVFRIAKFRSMVVDAERRSGAVWAREHDDRVTPVGRFLRRTRLDEIPQFWNVLRGDMRIIGPRPERPEFVQQLSAQVPYYRLRHMVKPGLTGWAQVMYRYGASVEDATVKLEHDLYYIKHQSLYLDALILIRTIRTVLRMQGH